MALAEQDAAAFARDGFLIMRGCFSAEQIAAVSTVARADPVVDAARRESAKQIQLWGYLSEDDAYSALARQRCIVAPIEQMLGPVEHYHHKLIMKERESFEDGTSTGTWEWHQDYGYWYGSYIYPNLASCFIAIDQATAANGALTVLRGSHAAGRI